MANNSVGNDLDFFGPTAPDQFDFTPLFEDTFLSIIPSAIFLVVLPVRIITLHGQPRKVSRSDLHGYKLVFIAVFVAFQIALLVLRATNSGLRTSATVAAASLAFSDAIALSLLSHFEHIHSIRPSAIINVYLLFTLIFDVARSRTLWLSGTSLLIATVFTAAVVIKALILVTEAIEKRGILLSRFQNSSPEVTSGIYSRSFFWWLNRLMTTGFRRVINNEDLYPIDDNMSSSVLQKKARKAWNSVNKSRSHALLLAIFKATWRPFINSIFPRICLMSFRYSQPFLLSRAVEFTTTATDSDNIGWGLTGAFALVFLGMAVSNGTYYHMNYRFVTTVRGSLVSIIYAKTVELSITALDESIALTLMSNDTEAICQGFANIHEVWAVPIEFGIALWLLQRQLGVAFFAPAAVSIVCMAGILIAAKYVGRAQKIWIESIQTRVDATASMLGSMKAVKMLGFTDTISSMIQNLRVIELQLSSRFRRLLCLRVFLGNTTGTFAPLATFIAFVISAKSTGQTLNTASAYAALSVISLIATPLNLLIVTIPMLTSAMACFGRIQSFLASDARRDLLLPLAAKSSVTQTETDLGGEDFELQSLLRAPHNRVDQSVIMDVQHASFSWTKDGAATIRDVSFTILRQQFCFIIGPVGCGKSTLMKGLLAETPSTKGFVYSNTPEIGYVDQTPWIQNVTIQQNILGTSSFEEPWYSQVVRACDLEQDISILPNKHATIVGSRGISLSGGQKQRLSIARAVYARKQSIFIDDAFSGLDAETEEQIFNRLLGKQGLLRKLGTTVLLVTHAVQRLPYADHIIVLGKTGQVVEQGSFQQLSTAGGYVEELATSHKTEEDSKTAQDAEMKESTTKISTTYTNVAKGEEEESDSSRQTSDFATYRYYFASIGWSRSLLFTGMIVVCVVSSKMTELLVSYWTSAVEARGNEVNALYISIYSALSGLATVALTSGAWYFLVHIVPFSAEKLHARLLKTVMAAPLSFFTSTDTGTTTNRFSQDMTVVDTELPYSLIDAMLACMEVIMGGVLMSLSAGYFVATMPPVILIVFILQKFYLRTSRQIRLLDLEAKSPLYSHFIESLSGLVTIRAFGWSGEFMDQNLALLDNSQKPYYLLFCIQRWLSLILDLLVAVLAIILMALVVKLRGEISAGHVGLALLNVMKFSDSLSYIVKEWTTLETSIGAIARLKNFSSQTPTENLPTERQQVSDNWPTHGAIQFKNVSASYTSGGKLVVRNLNMSVKAGEKIGICGRSGSGKSSLITTLFRMLEIKPESAITIDGIDITTLPRQTVRSRLNAIPQEPFFMKGTVRKNADPYQRHTDFEIIHAFEKVYLWDIVEQKGGLQAAMDAEFFSHGQRQLFCLARAILRKSKVIVLDEVTSSVDLKTDELMQRVIREEFDGCTIIAVAHRLDTILDFDKIALLSDGVLLEFEPPQALLARDSAFRQLYNS